MGNLFSEISLKVRPFKNCPKGIIFSTSKYRVTEGVIMIIKINGEELNFDKELSIKDFLETKKISADAVVVELNQNIIPLEKYQTTWLTHKDNLEILRFVGGG